jgi:fatty acid desaturase
MSSVIDPDSLRTAPHILKQVRALSTVSEWRGLWSVAVQWLVIGLSITAWYALPESLGSVRWLLYGLLVIVIGSRQHALLILMHDAAHGRISKNRGWNDFCSDVFCALPCGLSTELYRRRHLKHHQHTNTDKDPDWVSMEQYDDWHWPKAQFEAFRLFALDIIGLTGYKIFFAFMLWSPARRLFFRKKLQFTPAERCRVIGFAVALVTILWVYGLWLPYFMFWIVPFVTALSAITRMRTLAEHMVVDSEHTLNRTREVIPTFLERLFFAPLNVNYHLTHHLFPSVPHYRLPELHRLLMQEPVFRDNAHLTSSYWGLRRGVWAEVTKAKT